MSDNKLLLFFSFFFFFSLAEMCTSTAYMSDKAFLLFLNSTAHMCTSTACKADNIQQRHHQHQDS